MRSSRSLRRPRSRRGSTRKRRMRLGRKTARKGRKKKLRLRRN